ncbi:MAG: Zn-ribbon domain-containing OB-fold protein [Promethearchaeota archaeon]|nr:MAG: Zn-ribbon domain-containing OB-fold protein [Candidatus Lokiarchaeota archaeon]
MSEVEKDFTIESYLEFIRNKKLMGTRCKDCGAMFVPVRKLCIDCNSTNMEWVEMCGKGEIAAFTSITVGTPFFVEKGYDRNKPYCFSVIKLQEGPMVSGQLVGVDESKPETIHVGMPVKATFLQTDLKGDTRVDLGFEPV